MSERNQAAVTTAFSMSTYVTPRAPPNDHTRIRRLRARSASGTASRIVAPTYAPGATPNANGQPAHTPLVTRAVGSPFTPALAVSPIAAYPPCRLDEPMNESRGIKIATDASGRNAMNASAPPSADHPGAAPLRASVSAPTPRYATVRTVQTASPWLRCALATCDHARPPSPIHSHRRDHRRLRR